MTQEKKTQWGKIKRTLARMTRFEADAEAEAEVTSFGDLWKRLNGEWVLKQIPLLLIVVAYLLLLTTFRYQTQHQLIEREGLNRQIEDITYREMTVHSRLTELKRQSLIEKKLKTYGDSTLVTATEHVYVIPTNEDQ